MVVYSHISIAVYLLLQVLEGETQDVRKVAFAAEELLEHVGETPLPPYIHSYAGDPERYQTVYSRAKGSVAAPTAGLHFTPELLDRLTQKGVEIGRVTLHVGLDSFRPDHDR